MKKLLLASLIGAAFISTAASAATANLTVNATVTSKCDITTTPVAASITVDPALATAFTGSTTFGYKCTKGVTPNTFTLTSASGFVLSDGTNSMAYSIPTPPTASIGLGYGAAAEITKTVGVSIANAVGIAAVASTGYTDTIVITINP